MKIGILGPKGTFSEVALNTYKEKHDNVEAFYYQTLEETTESLAQLDKIIVPIENTLEGYVQQILDFLISSNSYIEEEILVYVQFELISKVEHKDISNIFVQFATKGQCQDYIKSLSNTDLTLTPSNSTSLDLFLNGQDSDAAIVPTHLVPKDVNHQNVTDSKNNFTRFVVISKNQIKTNAREHKVSLVVIPTIDRPGLLYDILSIFKSQDINLTSIMSRPQKNYMGKYFFYIEFIAGNHVYDDINQLVELTKEQYTIKILGIYPKQ